MTPIVADQLSNHLLVPLVTAAVRAVALAGIAGLGLAAFRVKTTSVRLFAWTGVLCAALAMPLLQWVLPSLPVPTPAILTNETLPSVTDEAVTAQPAGDAALDLTAAPRQQRIPAASRPAASANFAWSALPWNVVAAGIYSTVAFLLLARFVVGVVLSRRLRRASQTIREPRITSSLAARAQATGLSHMPAAAESEFISVPLTMGVLRPAILLPLASRDWDDAKLDAVIAHELSHIARRDALTQRISLLHCSIFWFSPLAWWLNRRLADLMEQASDEAALSGGADRKVYARTLLGFFEALQGVPRRVWWQGVAMASAGRAERSAEERVERILAWKGVVAMSLKKSIAGIVLALAVPVVYLAASANPADRGGDLRSANSVLIAQNQTPPTPPPAPHAKAPKKKSPSHNFYSFSNDDDDRQSYVIVSGQGGSVTMSGMHDDGEGVEELKKKIQGDFIWFRRDRKSYVIRDQATINRARAFWAPQEELGRKQEELGKQQEVLGKQQEELGEKMEQVRVHVPDLTKELEKLQSEMKELSSSGATMEQLGQLSERIGELQSKIGDVQSAAGDQQSKLGEEMGALGEKQGKLGEQQGELGRQQGELAEQATRQMKQLLDESVAKGTAKLEQ